MMSLPQKKKRKAVKISRERMTQILIENGFTEEQIKEHYRNKDRQATADAKKKKKQNEKPKAVIYGGYNTVQK